ncbi:MAG: alginate lyase family protein [Clostridia bacterium]|nr:alginate lyase family protein [Clostridia bacterium]
MNIPNTITYSGAALVEMKQEKKVAESVLNELKRRAEELLSEPQIAVVHRKTRPITKNPHEYASQAPYWWPNPDTPDGLPYIRKDGVANPIYFDEMSFVKLCDKIHVLTLAAYHLDEDKYAEKSVKMIYDWFLNPETYMVPHAEYAQAIPGICDGRGIGVVDFCYSYKIFDSIAILEAMGKISEEIVRGVKEWYVKFADWMITSEKGLDEDLQENNHGTYFDVAVLAAAIFTERKFLADKICTTAYIRRFKHHVEPDGKQPLELARTRAMNYSLQTARGLMLIANMAKRCGHTVFLEKDAECGTCLVKAAVDFVYPYAKDMSTFPYEEIKPESVPEEVTDVLLRADGLFPGEGYGDKAMELAKGPYICLAHPAV